MSTLYDALRQLQNDRVEESRNWLSTGGYVAVVWEDGTESEYTQDEDLMRDWEKNRRRGVGLEEVSSSCL